MTDMKRASYALSGSAVLFLAGCASEFTYVPVRGTVTLKGGKPVAGGTVMFVPDKENKLRKVAAAPVRPDGTYELDTEGRSGVPVGSYLAVVKWPQRKVDGVAPGPSPFASKYAFEEQTPLRMEVVADPAPGAYDLVLDPSGRAERD
jgi:hypothetical protein